MGDIRPLTSKYAVVQLIYCFSFCCVNCFGLLSGYVGKNAKYKCSNMIMIWLNTVWYSLLIGVLCFILIDDVDTNEVIKSLFPISNSSYWYVNAYFIVFLSIPILNAAVKIMSRKKMGIILSAAFLGISVYQTVIREDVLGTGTGYSAMWLIYLYLVGAYIRWNNVQLVATSKKWLWGAFAMLAAT